MNGDGYGGIISHGNGKVIGKGVMIVVVVTVITAAAAVDGTPALFVVENVATLVTALVIEVAVITSVSIGLLKKKKHRP